MAIAIQQTLVLDDSSGTIVWLTADPHLGHQGLLDNPNNTRPWTKIDKHDKALLRNARELIKPSNVLIVVGDLTLAGSQRSHVVEQYIRRLPNCTKIPVLGNHDRLKAQKYVEYGFSIAATSLVLPGNVLVVHDPSAATVWPKDKPVICGHVHDLFQVLDNVVNVGVDVWDFKPVQLEVALGICSAKRSYRDWRDISENRHTEGTVV